MEAVESQSPQTSAPAIERQRSTIEFPYTDLDNAVEIAQGVHRAGGPSCEVDQLAAALDAKVDGGNFRLRLSGARLHGLIAGERGGKVVLTELGQQVVDPQRSRSAKVAAFLNVPLYQKVYEQFKGNLLPPQPALERVIESMGVGSKVRDRARQVLMRSAKQAGFLDHAPDRLVKPSMRGDRDEPAPATAHAASAPPHHTENDGGRRHAGGGGSGGGRQHPLIQGLMMTLPEPGSEWDGRSQVNWLLMAASIFKIIYTEQVPSTITISQETTGGTMSAT